MEISVDDIRISIGNLGIHDDYAKIKIEWTGK